MSKGRSHQGKKQTGRTRLSQHKRQGKILKPPMRTFPMTTVPWLRDMFPDMLWICYLIEQYGDKPGMVLAAKFIDCVEDVVNEGLEDDADDAIVISGALTSFDLVPEDKRGKVISELRARGLFELGFPWVLARALSKYSKPPAGWLIDAWAGHEQIVPADTPERHLRELISSASHGQSSTATKAKILFMRSMFKHGKIKLTREIGEVWGDILPRYPDKITEEERKRIESSMRAAFMSMATLGDEHRTPSISADWAKAFWRENWKLYECEADEQPDTEPDDERAAQAIAEAQQSWRQALKGVVDDFLSAERSADPDLYSPDRHEVLTGIAFRLLRMANMMVESPPQWTTEHGSSIMRSLVEGHIVLRWLIKQDSDELYERFKDYGRGKLKLLKLHLEEYRETLDEVPQELDNQIEYLDALVNRDLMEEFQDISIEGNFAGVDTRKMAEQVDMLPDYRFTFSPASSGVHGEWAFLDQYILATCRNPLHRWHRIPDSQLGYRLGPDLVELALRRVSDIVEDYKAAI